MPRIAFHLQIQEGKRERYREKHENVPDELQEAYLESAAGLETYSVFEKDGHVFGYMEVKNTEEIKEVMANSNAQERWSDVMNSILEENDGEIWMDEVYRMV